MPPGPSARARVTQPGNAGVRGRPRPVAPARLALPAPARACSIGCMLVESVPNVSEGRRLDVVERLADALTSVPGVFLLDRTSDASHNRSVFTVAGEHERRVGGPRAARGAGGRRHRHGAAHGRAPAHRRGRRDPVRPAGRHDDGRLRGARPRLRRADRPAHDLPVYLYAAAATRSDRVKLADVRRGQYEGLKAEIAQNGRQPDFGPPRMHPRFGAVAVGARPFLIAWNINLDSDDVELAKRIARRVRESGGGLPRRPGERLPGRGAGARPPGPRPGVDEPPRLPHDADLAGLGGRRRAGGRGRRASSPSRS